jgi:hypothetical protein
MASLASSRYNSMQIVSNVDVRGRFEIANNVANGNSVGIRIILIDLRKTIRFSNTKKDRRKMDLLMLLE